MRWRRLEEETVEEEGERKKNESLDHQVEEVEPLELPPAGHLRIGRVPEDKVPNPLAIYVKVGWPVEATHVKTKGTPVLLGQ